MNKFIPISQPHISEKDIEYVTDAVRSGWVSSIGKYIEMFEESFASYCGTRFALSTANGTTALHLALVSLGISSEHEVIIPDLTFVATANAVKYTGAKVVTVDIEEDTLCIDPQKIEAAITPNTRAIIPVHLYGHPADMHKIMKLAVKYDLHVIEDAAEAHGACINGQRVGSFGDCGVFSFYGNKIITAGEGGMVTTNNEALYEKMKFLRDHAMSREKRYWHTDVGYNYRITNLQAALGVAQLNRIEQIIEKKAEIYFQYRQELQNVKGLKLNYTKENVKNVFWMICVEIDDLNEKMRDQLMQRLRKENIDTRPYFYPISDMPMFENANTDITHKVFQRGFNLPSFFDLKESEVCYICQKLKELI